MDVSGNFGLTEVDKKLIKDMADSFDKATGRKKKDKLKSCPFCGSEKVSVCNEHYAGMAKPVIFVECKECKGRGGHSMDGNRERAISKWNIRHTKILTDVEV